MDKHYDSWISVCLDIQMPSGFLVSQTFLHQDQYFLVDNSQLGYNKLL